MGDTLSTSANCQAVAGGGLRPELAPELWQREEWGSWPGRSRHPDLEAGARDRVIVWLVMGTDVCKEVTGAPAASEGSAALGTVVAAPQGLVPEPGPRFLSREKGRFILHCRCESNTKPGGGALAPLFFLQVLYLCPCSWSDGIKISVVSVFLELSIEI